MISFDALAGNNALKNSLKHALNERFPQTVLLSGDDPAAHKEEYKIEIACIILIATILICIIAMILCARVPMLI